MPTDSKHWAPRVETGGDSEVLVFEGKESPFFNLSGAAGTRAKDVQALSKTKEVGRKGGWDADARIEDMDFDGVDAAVLFGAGLGGGIEMQVANRPLRFAMMQAYNDWLAEFCKSYPQRLIGIAEIPVWDAELALKESERAAQMGLRGVTIPAIPAFPDSPPEDKPYTDPSYERLWTGLAEMKLPIHFHLGTKPVTRGLERELLVSVSTNKTSMSEPIACFIFSGALERHPDLKIISVESGIGWMAFFIQWMDHNFEKHRYHTKSTLSEPPSFYFHRQVFGTFIDDRVGVRNRDVIGVENILWSSDYPHINSTWPESRKSIEEHFRGVPEDEKRKMVAENAANLYGL